MPCGINGKQHGFNTLQISLAAAAARDILVNFEISLTVFIPNKPIENVTYFIFSENNNYATTVTTLQAQGSRLVFCNIVISTKDGGSDR